LAAFNAIRGRLRLQLPRAIARSPKPSMTK
jgi:hypothetical protein